VSGRCTVRPDEPDVHGNGAGKAIPAPIPRSFAAHQCSSAEKTHGEGEFMGRAHVRAHGTFPPERFVSALVDFGPGRSEVWGNSDPRHLAVHDRGDTWAEVTEGSGAGGGVWQRLRYDWSTPGQVTLEVLDSNAFGPGGSWTYRLEPDGAGGTDIDLTVVRVPCSLKGRVLDVLLGLGGSRYFARDLRRSVRRLEQSRAPS
jgi:hypothetical protein